MFLNKNDEFNTSLHLKNQERKPTKIINKHETHI